MQIYRFDGTTGHPVSNFGSAFSLTHLLHLGNNTVQVSCARLARKGRIGLHPAAAPQLMLVVEGKGWVRGDDADPVSICAGEAAFWRAGEAHEAHTDAGLVAIIIEGRGVDPSRYMSPA